MRVIAGVVILLTVLFASRSFEEAVAPDPDDKPLRVDIWCPSKPGDGSKIAGHGLPLVVFSHGTGGSGRGHEVVRFFLEKLPPS